MIEINLTKIQQVRVRATARRKAHTRRIKSKVAEREAEIWKKWQQHYLTHLFRPSAEPHEDFFSTAIMMSYSPEQAASKIRNFQRRNPPSVGGDLAEEFRRLYHRTRDAVIENGIKPMSGWIQTERPRKTGV